MRKEYMNLNTIHAELIKDVVGRIRRYMGEPTTDEALLDVLEPLIKELENMRRELQFPVKEPIIQAKRFNYLDEFNSWSKEHKNVIGIHLDSKDRVIVIYHDYGGDDE